MNRRHFLRSTVLVAGALALGGCGDGAPDAKTDVDAKAGTDADGAGEPPLVGTPQDGSQFFPQSVCSGDPKSDSVILWTRWHDSAAGGADGKVRLQVALDPGFTQLHQLDGKTAPFLPAAASAGHCVKVRVTGLQAATTYHYRFLYEQGGKLYATRAAQTRTAPAADADVPVRFAVVSCQDFNGKVFNAYRRLAELDVDFLVHLGDYVYETTGNPSFQDKAGRKLTFTDPASALVFNQGTPDEFYAAKSISNYRDLYQVTRTDLDLQRIHEKVPMIAVWDDHEFSDDCHGQTATYFAGAKDEKDPARRTAADQAWFEHMPVDYLDTPDYKFDPADAFPGKFRIYRDFGFGRHVHLVMTDLRRYRSDHVVPEAAFPGAVVLTEAQIQAAHGSVPASATGYLDVATYAGGSYAALLQAGAAKLGYAAADFQGNLSALWVNARVAELTKAGANGKNLAPIAEAELAKLPRGYAYHHLLKTSRYSSLGSRYFVVEEPFRILAKARWAESKGASEQAMGEAQEKWFLSTMQASKKTWKVWGNEFTLTQRAVDLTGFKSLPAAFRARFLLSAEDWDGLPNRRDQLLSTLAKIPNVVAVTGDIHAFFVGTPAVTGKLQERIVEFVGGAISSGTYKTLLVRQAGSDPGLQAAGAEALAALAEELLLGSLEATPAAHPNQTLAYAALDQHGFLVVEANGQTLTTTCHQIAESEAKAVVAGPLADKFKTVRFRVQAGAADVYQEIAGAWKKWDHAAQAWN